MKFKEAERLVNQWGSVTRAAREEGIPRSTLWDAYRRGQKSHKVCGDATKRVAADQKKRIKELEQIVEQQKEAIARTAKARYRLPKATGKAPETASYSRIVVPDTHGCFVDEDALLAFLVDLERIPDIRQVVMLGDHVDCGGFLAQHHTMGYVAEATYSYEDDIDATNQLIDHLQAACPQAEIHYLEGNHERRVEKWCLTQTLSHAKDAQALLDLYGPEARLNIQQRGIHYYRQGKIYMGLPVPATIRLGHCHFTHGSRTGKHPCSAMLADFGHNVVFGHVHRMDSYHRRTVDRGVIGAWSPGCLCRLQPLWSHTQITGWAHGYGLQLVQDDGTFLHINVPIINGESYLTHLLSPAA